MRWSTKRTRCAAKPPPTRTEHRAAKRAIKAGIDSIEHGSFLDDEALDMMKARGTYYVPTMMAAQGLREILEKGSLPPQIAAKARAAMAALDRDGGEGDRQASQNRAGHGRGRVSARAQRGRVRADGAGGHESDRRVEGRDVRGRAAFGLFEKTGSLEAGKWADIVAVPGNPVEDIHATEKVMFVMKEGTVFKNAKR